ncbi:MAG: hypothetical protein HPY52_14610 [Firmicutes bacterium]|nr:hypothetical protein [Bacillota bacterium]
MTARELLEELWSLGVNISLNGDKLHIEVPPGVEINGLKPELIQHKSEIVTLLQSQIEEVQFVGNCPVLIVNGENPLDYPAGPENRPMDS